jgi:hypothetical protein
VPLSPATIGPAIVASASAIGAVVVAVPSGRNTTTRSAPSVSM